MAPSTIIGVRCEQRRIVRRSHAPWSVTEPAPSGATSTVYRCPRYGIPDSRMRRPVGISERGRSVISRLDSRSCVCSLLADRLPRPAVSTHRDNRPGRRGRAIPAQRAPGAAGQHNLCVVPRIPSARMVRPGRSRYGGILPRSGGVVWRPHGASVVPTGLYRSSPWRRALPQPDQVSGSLSRSTTRRQILARANPPKANVPGSNQCHRPGVSARRGPSHNTPVPASRTLPVRVPSIALPRPAMMRRHSADRSLRTVRPSPAWQRRRNPALRSGQSGAREAGRPRIEYRPTSPSIPG